MRLGHDAIDRALRSEMDVQAVTGRSKQRAAYGDLDAAARRVGQQIGFALHWFGVLDVESDQVIVSQPWIRLASDDRPDKLREILDHLGHRSPRWIRPLPLPAARTVRD